MKRCSSGSLPFVLGFTLCIIGGLSSPHAVAATETRLDVAVSTPVMLHSRPQSAFVKVSLQGAAFDSNRHRTPVNVAIVIDQSGSMAGEKMRRAKEAAIMAIEKLNANDILSVVSYSNTVQVVVPATKVDDREAIYSAIGNLFARGGTALFAGVSKGAQQVRKFADPNRVNRVILVSDGLANIGPESPGELGSLGRSLAREGISVTTIGLGEGYNEDLMVALAGNSDGNHAYAQSAMDLAAIFQNEFGDLLSVVAKDVRIKIQFSSNVRPIRSLGRSAHISNRAVDSRLTQLYAGQEKFVLLEVEVSPGPAGVQSEIASVDITYSNLMTNTTDVVSRNVYVSFTDSWSDVEQYRNDDVMVAGIELIAAEAQKSAILLRDNGKTREAEAALENNARFLDEAGNKYKSKRLQQRAVQNRSAKKNLSPSNWGNQRKMMSDDNFAIDHQQAW